MRSIWKRERGPSEATRAREQAERDLAATKAETAPIKAFAARLLEVQKVNHLGEGAHRVLRGDK